MIRSVIENDLAPRYPIMLFRRSFPAISSKRRRCRIREYAIAENRMHSRSSLSKIYIHEQRKLELRFAHEIAETIFNERSL